MRISPRIAAALWAERRSDHRRRACCGLVMRTSILRSWLACVGLSLSGVAAFLPASAEETEWALSTKDTQIRIGIRAGAEAILELHTVGAPWQWAQTPNVQELPKSVTQGGVVSQLHWTYSGAHQDTDRTLTLVFKNTSPALELKSHWKALSGLGPIE